MLIWEHTEFSIFSEKSKQNKTQRKTMKKKPDGFKQESNKVLKVLKSTWQQEYLPK